MLLRPAESNDSEAAAIETPDTTTGNPERFRLQLDVTETDTEGRFRFEPAPSGEILVHASLGWGLGVTSQPLELEPGGARDDVMLVLPASRRLEGRVVGVAPGSLQGFRVLVVPSAGIDFENFLGTQYPRAEIDAEERFVFEALPFRSLALFLMHPSEHWNVGYDPVDGFPRGAARLGTLLAAEPCTSELEFPLVGELGLLTIDAKIECACDAHRLSVTLYDAGGRNTLCRWRFDEAGRLSAPALAGTYVIWLSHSIESTGCRVEHPGVVRVEPGRETATEIEARFVAGELELADELGRTLWDQHVRVRRADQGESEPPVSTARTDFDGVLRLCLAPGDYVLSCTDPRGPGRETLTATVEWDESSRSRSLRLR